MRNRLTMGLIAGMVIGVLLASVGIVLAGNLDPTEGPTGTNSQMYTLAQVYERIDTGAAATKMISFTEPTGAPGGTGYDLNDLYDLAGERSRPAKTGQTDCYYDNGSTGTCTCGAANCPADQDGGLEKGVTWPSPRFADNGDGTVTDNLTGLIWLQRASCLGSGNWLTATTEAGNLSNGYTGGGDGGYDCNLSDGSSAGDWRLPSLRELHSLIDYGENSPALPSSEPFDGENIGTAFWSSTTLDHNSTVAWVVSINTGAVETWPKTNTGRYIWPVRGGQ